MLTKDSEKLCQYIWCLGNVFSDRNIYITNIIRYIMSILRWWQWIFL